MTNIYDLLKAQNTKKERVVSVEEKKSRLAIIRHLFIDDYVLSGNSDKIPSVEILARLIESVDDLQVPTASLRRVFKDAREAKMERFKSQAPLSFYDISYIVEKTLSRDACVRELQDLRYSLPNAKDTALMSLPEVRDFLSKIKKGLISAQRL